MNNVETPLERAKKFFAEKIESELKLKSESSEHTFMQEAMLKQGSDIAFKTLSWFFDDYFKLLWRLKGMKIHSHKDPEDIKHILTEYIPNLADLKLIEIYNSLGVNFAALEQAEEYYGRLEEG